VDKKAGVNIWLFIETLTLSHQYSPLLLQIVSVNILAKPREPNMLVKIWENPLKHVGDMQRTQNVSSNILPLSVTFVQTDG